MSLTICPECNKEISDKNKQCIHCGYQLINTRCLINGIEFDFSDELPIALLPEDKYYPAIGAIRKKTSLTLADGCNFVKIIRDLNAIPNEFNPQYPLENRNKYTEKQESINNIKCHYCGSTNTKKITTTSKAVHTALFGIWSMGRNSKNYHCNSCGSDF